MAKPGRNDPCPCGSGKKYKRCCRDQDLAAAYGADHAQDELTVASNAAVDLVHEGRLDEAEQAARDLIVRFPDAHDGWDRLGMVYEARANTARQPIATGKPSPSSATTPTITIPASRTSSTTSSPDSIRPLQPDRRARAS